MKHKEKVSFMRENFFVRVGSKGRKEKGKGNKLNWITNKYYANFCLNKQNSWMVQPDNTNLVYVFHRRAKNGKPKKKPN